MSPDHPPEQRARLTAPAPVDDPSGPAEQLGLSASSDLALCAAVAARAGEASQDAGALAALLASRLAAARSELGELAAALAQRDSEISRLRLQLTLAQDHSLDREVAADTFEKELLKRDQLYGQIRSSLSFRLGMVATAPLRWLLAQVTPAQR